MLTPALSFLFLLGLLLVGVLQARKNTEEPALLRWQAWQILVGLVGVVLVLARSKLSVSMPHLSGGGMALKAVLVLALLLAVVLLVRKRRAGASV